MKSRRTFLSHASTTSAGVLCAGGALLTGMLNRAYGQSAAGYYDLYVKFEGKPDSDAIIITAAQLKAGKEVTSSWRDVDHYHSVAISSAAIQSVNAGKTFSGKTGTTNNHAHNFTINPADKVPGGTFIAKADVKAAADDSDKLSNAEADLALILGAGASPHVFAEVLSSDIDLKTLNFCITKSESDQCAIQNAISFVPLPNSDGRKVFASHVPLTLVDGDILQLTGNDTSGAVKRLVARVTKINDELSLE